MQPEDVASAIFTVTDDLVSTFPAQAAVKWAGACPDALCPRDPRAEQSAAGDPCARSLEYELSQYEITHVYLRDAVKLRPDLGRPHNKS